MGGSKQKKTEQRAFSFCYLTILNSSENLVYPTSSLVLTFIILDSEEIWLFNFKNMWTTWLLHSTMKRLLYYSLFRHTYTIEDNWSTRSCIAEENIVTLANQLRKRNEETQFDVIEALTSHHFSPISECLPISRSCHGCAATDLLVMDEIILSLRGGCEEWWEMETLFGVSFGGTTFATWNYNNQ